VKLPRWLGFERGTPKPGVESPSIQPSPYRNQLYKQKSCYGYAMHSFPVPLCIGTVPLATGFPVVVASVNDCFDEAVIEALHELGGGLIDTEALLDGLRRRGR
jgi:hypothetical protein